MQKYQDLIVALFKGYLKYNHYSIFSVWLRVLVWILMIPFHMMVILLGLLYVMIYFFIMMIRVPADFIKQTIDENKGNPAATQVIVYLFSYPSKFTFDVITAFSLTLLAWIFVFLQIFVFFGSLGNSRFQPFLLHATLDVYKPRPTYRLNRKIEILIGSIVIFVLMVIAGSLYFVRQIRNDQELYLETSQAIANTIQNESISNGYVIESVYYRKASEELLFSIRYGGMKYFFWYQYGSVSELSQYDYQVAAELYKPLDLTRIIRLTNDLID